MKYILLFFLIFFVSCNEKNKLVADYNLNGNLNDFAQANLAEDYGEIEFVRTTHTKGLEFNNNKPVSYIKLPNITINPKEYTISEIVKFKDFKHNNTILFYGSKKETWSTSGLWIYTDKNKIAVVQENQILSNKDYKYANKKNDIFKNSIDLEPNKEFVLTLTYKNNKLNIYIDGKKYAHYKNVKPITNKQRELLIGIANDPAGKGKFQLNGVVDEIKIYSISLNEKEIQDLFNSYQN